MRKSTIAIGIAAALSTQAFVATTNADAAAKIKPSKASGPNHSTPHFKFPNRTSPSGGTVLYDDDKLRTERGGSAELHFPSGTVVVVSEDTLLGIAETRAAPGRPQADVTVLRGAGDATLDRPANQSLTVGTPAATVRAGREIVFQ